jgi:hypothetical protein
MNAGDNADAALFTKLRLTALQGQALMRVAAE